MKNNVIKFAAFLMALSFSFVSECSKYEKELIASQRALKGTPNTEYNWEIRNALKDSISRCKKLMKLEESRKRK